MRRLQFVCILFAVALTAARTVSNAADPYWPTFHGPQGNNISEDTGLLDAWPEDGPPLAWTVEGIGEGYSGISTANGLIYTSGNLDGQSVVTALDWDGTVVWRQANGPAWAQSNLYPGTRSTPTIDGDRVYDESPLGHLACMNAKTGDIVWTVDLMETFDAEIPKWALAESVQIDGDRVIACPMGQKGSVVALDKMDGSVVWTSPAMQSAGAKAGYATPTIATHDGVPMVLTFSEKELIAVRADNGKGLFTFPYETKYGVNATKPLYHDGAIFLTSGYGTIGSKLVRLTGSGDDLDVEQVWHNEEMDNHHGGVVLLDGYVYGSSHSTGGGRWMCLDWDTGETEYPERGVGKGSLTCAEGKLYTLSERSNVGLVDATPEAHELISSFRLPRKGEGPTWAHPVVVGKRLFLRHGDYLFAYDVAK